MNNLKILKLASLVVFSLLPTISLAVQDDSSNSENPSLSFTPPTSAIRALQADQSNFANHADFSVRAQSSISADNSQTADSAAVTNFAGQAGEADVASEVNFADRANVSDSSARADFSTRSANADLLDGRNETFFRDADNLTTGTIHNNRLAADLGNRSIDRAREGGDVNSLSGQTLNYFNSSESAKRGTFSVDRLEGIYEIDISGQAATTDFADHADRADIAESADIIESVSGSLEGSQVGSSHGFDFEAFANSGASGIGGTIATTVEELEYNVPTGATAVLIQLHCEVPPDASITLGTFQFTQFIKTSIEFIGSGLPAFSLCSISDHPDELTSIQIQGDDIGLTYRDRTHLLDIPQGVTSVKLRFEGFGQVLAVGIPVQIVADIPSRANGEVKWLK